MEGEFKFLERFFCRLIPVSLHPSSLSFPFIPHAWFLAFISSHLLSFHFSWIFGVKSFFWPSPSWRCPWRLSSWFWESGMPNRWESMKKIPFKVTICEPKLKLKYCWRNVFIAPLWRPSLHNVIGRRLFSSFFHINSYLEDIINKQELIANIKFTFTIFLLIFWGNRQKMAIFNLPLLILQLLLKNVSEQKFLRKFHKIYSFK